MVAGEGVLGDYTADHHLHRPDGQRGRPGGPQARGPRSTLRPGTFQGAEWKKVSAAGSARVLDVQPLREGGPPRSPATPTATRPSLHNTNGQIVSVMESEPFILL